MLLRQVCQCKRVRSLENGYCLSLSLPYCTNRVRLNLLNAWAPKPTPDIDGEEVCSDHRVEVLSDKLSQVESLLRSGAMTCSTNATRAEADAGLTPRALALGRNVFVWWCLS